MYMKKRLQKRIMAATLLALVGIGTFVSPLTPAFAAEQENSQNQQTNDQEKTKTSSNQESSQPPADQPPASDQTPQSDEHAQHHVH